MRSRISFLVSMCPIGGMVDIAFEMEAMSLRGCVDSFPSARLVMVIDSGVSLASMPASRLPSFMVRETMPKPEAIRAFGKINDSSR